MPPINFPFKEVRNRPTACEPTAVNDIPCVELGQGSFGSLVRSSMNSIHWTNSRTKPFYFSFLQDTHFFVCLFYFVWSIWFIIWAIDKCSWSWLSNYTSCLVSIAIQEALPFFLPLKNSPWLPSVWLSLLSRQNNNAPGSSWFFTLIKS